MRTIRAVVTCVPVRQLVTISTSIIAPDSLLIHCCPHCNSARQTFSSQSTYPTWAINIPNAVLGPLHVGNWV